MYYKFLEKHLSNNPEVINKKGILLRQRIQPYIHALLKLTNPYRLKVEGKTLIPTKPLEEWDSYYHKDDIASPVKMPNEPINFFVLHGYKDDIRHSTLAIAESSNIKSTTILFGPTDIFFRTYNGILLDLVSVVKVDREDKVSKKASRPKLIRAHEFGNNTAVFSEASWNMSPNLLVAKMYIGGASVANETGHLSADLSLHTQGRGAYAIFGEAFDIGKMTPQIARDTLTLMKKRTSKVIDLCGIYNEEECLETGLAAIELISMIEAERQKAETLIKMSEDRGITASSILSELEESIKAISKNASSIKKNIKTGTGILTPIDDIMMSNFNLLNDVVHARDIVVMNYNLRDKKATSKYELMKRHSCYDNTPGQPLRLINGNWFERTIHNLREVHYSIVSNINFIFRGKKIETTQERLKSQWEKYKNREYNRVKYFYPDKEESVMYHDSNESSASEVFVVHQVSDSSEKGLYKRLGQMHSRNEQFNRIVKR